jgi:1-acyl-sn-glycerol-3-phosphate acyltransferase
VRLGRIGFWYRLAVVIAKPPLLLLTRRRWVGFEHVPATGGVILAANHISFVDPFCLGDAILFSARRSPRFLAKSSLFEGNGLVGRTVRGSGQIPVHRNTADASHALKSAVEALQAGELVLIYPEGTVSRDPDKWPMATKTGVARLALLSGAPVLPVAQWGAQEIHDSYRTGRLNLLARPVVTVEVGPPVDLSSWRGQELTGPVLRGATDAVMSQVRSMLERIRGEQAPAVVFDPENREIA